MYPMPVEVLSGILNSESKAVQTFADKNHDCMVALNKGGHYIVLFFLGNTKKIHYLDSFRNSPF